jgi:hypothetical protein
MFFWEQMKPPGHANPTGHTLHTLNTPEGAVVDTLPSRVMPAGSVSVKLLAAGEGMPPVLVLHTSNNKHQGQHHQAHITYTMGAQNTRNKNSMTAQCAL